MSSPLSLLAFASSLWLTAPAMPAALDEEMDPPFVTWVEDGQAAATIVCAPPAEGTSPATELNWWLERMTGVGLPVANAAPDGRPRVFLGGEAAWRRLRTTPDLLGIGGQGYAIRTVGNDLVIAGKTNLGTLFGVHAFLERYLGCRWFWPDESGLVAPKRDMIRIGQIDERSEPDFPIRWLFRTPACARFNRCNVNLGEPDDFRLHWAVHTWLRLVEPSRYWREHPEFYADHGGKRADPTGPRSQVNLCTTNPQVVEAAVRKIDELMEAYPGTDMISVDPMDTQQFCSCENCRKLQDPDAPYEARNSRLVFSFTNRVAEEVAKRHPKLLIKTIAYHTYLAPPPFKLPDNVVIQFCRFMCHNHSLAEPECEESAYFNKYLLAWRGRCRQIIFYEYYYKASWCGLPWPLVHMLRADLPYLHRNGVTGIASQWDHNYANNGLGQYVAGKLLWDSSLDVDGVLADFYEKAYAEAAAPMRRYHERLERALAESGLHVAEQRGYRTMWRFLSPALIEGCSADLKAARAVVRDAGAARRVELMTKGFDYARLIAQYLGVIAARVEQGTKSWWYGESGVSMDGLETACEPHVAALREFLESKDTVGARHALGPYEELLLSSKNVAGNWHRSGDRDGDLRLTKPQWLARHPQQLARTLPTELTLWVYGNDIDWMPDTGPEHNVFATGRDGKPVLLGTMGRQDRHADGKNAAFVFRGIDPSRLKRDPLEVTIDNPPGGPYATRIFAVYLMPEDGATEAAATRLIQDDLESVRRKAAAFIEYGFNGQMSREGSPVVAELELPAVGER